MDRLERLRPTRIERAGAEPAATGCDAAGDAPAGRCLRRHTHGKHGRTRNDVTGIVGCRPLRCPCRPCRCRRERARGSSTRSARRLHRGQSAGAGGGSRTHTVARAILSRLRLPFRHAGLGPSCEKCSQVHPPASICARSDRWPRPRHGTRRIAPLIGACCMRPAGRAPILQPGYVGGRVTGPITCASRRRRYRAARCRPGPVPGSQHGSDNRLLPHCYRCLKVWITLRKVGTSNRCPAPGSVLNAASHPRSRATHTASVDSIPNSLMSKR